MTLKDVGEICKLQTKKVNEVTDHIRILVASKDDSTLNSGGIVMIREEILSGIIDELIDYRKHLEAVLEEEVVLKE